MLENVYECLNAENEYEGLNARSKVYLSKVYFCEMYRLTCLLSFAILFLFKTRLPNLPVRVWFTEVSWLYVISKSSARG